MDYFCRPIGNNSLDIILNQCSIIRIMDLSCETNSKPGRLLYTREKVPAIVSSIWSFIRIKRSTNKDIIFSFSSFLASRLIVFMIVRRNRIFYDYDHYFFSFFQDKYRIILRNFFVWMKLDIFFIERFLRINILQFQKKFKRSSKRIIPYFFSLKNNFQFWKNLLYRILKIQKRKKWSIKIFASISFLP